MSEETIKRRSKSKLEILCYVTSAVMLAAALFMTVTNIIYIVNYMSAYGYGFTDMWMEKEDKAHTVQYYSCNQA